MNQPKEILIYALRDPRTSQVRYVGKTFRLDCRMNEHLREARAKKLQTPKVRWLRKLLPLIPVVEILERCSPDTWVEGERRWIAEMRERCPNLTNLLDGGETAPFENGRGHTEESKAKMRAAALRDGRRPGPRNNMAAWNKGKTCPPETLEKLRTSHLGQVAWNRGRPWSAESKAKMSTSHMGQPSSRKGQKASLETRAKLRASHLGLQSGNKGKKWTPEMKARMRETQLARHHAIRRTLKEII